MTIVMSHGREEQISVVAILSWLSAKSIKEGVAQRGCAVSAPEGLKPDMGWPQSWPCFE